MDISNTSKALWFWCGHHSLYPSNDKLRQHRHPLNSGVWSNQETNQMFTGSSKTSKTKRPISKARLLSFSISTFSQPFCCLKSSSIQNSAPSFCFISFTCLHISHFTKFCDVGFELCYVSSLSHLLSNPSHLHLPILLPWWDSKIRFCTFSCLTTNKFP